MHPEHGDPCHLACLGAPTLCGAYLCFEGVEKLAHPWLHEATPGPHAPPAEQTPYFEDSRTTKFYFNKPEKDGGGLMRILVFNSCRGNPFKPSVAEI